MRRVFEWERYPCIGESPMLTALNHPGVWQLVYELRPLEMIPYWLGIPFRPCHELRAIIYDEVNRGFYTYPASKIQELGCPSLVYGQGPLATLLDALSCIDLIFFTCADWAYDGVHRLKDAWRRWWKHDSVVRAHRKT